MGMDGGIEPLRHVRRRAFKRPGHESGAIAIMAMGALIIICGVCGLALDLSRLFNRKMEMQSAADAAALGSAIELDGTKAGISKAAQKASSLFAIPVVYGGLSFGYHKESMTWSDSAIRFSTTPDGPWIDRGTAAARNEPNGLLYVQVDTGGLDPSYGQVDTWFMRVVSSALASASTTARAVAGPSAIAVTPLGICAMRPEAKRNRNGELEEYGFRRGVAYDLMQLNPEASDTAQSFLIHPFAGPGSTGTSASDFDTVAPAVCTGTMGIARVTGGDISISAPFPLDDLYRQLNSRFDSYTAPCNPDTAPPDRNVKSYTFNDGSVPWMTVVPEGQASSVYPDAANHTRWTVTGPDPSPAGTKAEQYGPLWTYAKAVRYANPAPSGGYVVYDKSNWKDIYTPGLPSAKSSYPSQTPYLASGATYSRSPTHTGLRDRRVLNVALLSCPVAGNRATVQGIGRFFMTVPADATHLYAEFAGLAEEQTLRARVKLYP
jgi:hypothetical protein